MGNIKLAVPEFFYYEIASGIRKAIMRDYITAIEGQKAIDYILQLDIKTYPIPNVKIVYNIAQSYKRSIYDSIYIALAQIMEAEFWTTVMIISANQPTVYHTSSRKHKSCNACKGHAVNRIYSSM